MTPSLDKSDAPYDPILKLAMQEIKPILQKYGLVAFVVLSSETHGEELLHLPEVSWSGICLINDKVRIRFSSEEDPGFHRLRATLSALHTMMQATGKFYGFFKEGHEWIIQLLQAQGFSIKSQATYTEDLNP